MAAMNAEVSSPVPAWFTQAVETQATAAAVEVRGVRIAYRVWNPDAARVVLLVHGAAANARWWDHVAPHIAAGLRVVAMDLSGHGDSGWRDRYSLEDWAHEVAAVIDAQGAGDRCVVVAHSLGGLVAQQLLNDRLKTLDGVMFLDAPMHRRDAQVVAEREARAARPSRVFDDPALAVRAYRTRPVQRVILPYVKRHVAEQSLHAVPGGWAWKFDTRIYLRPELTDDFVQPVPCRGLLMRAAEGSINQDTLRMMLARWQGTVRSLDILDAGHHLMFDQPLALIAAILAALHAWKVTPEPAPATLI